MTWSLTVSSLDRYGRHNGEQPEYQGAASPLTSQSRRGAAWRLDGSLS